MASRTYLPSSNADFLLQYMEDLSDSSGSEDEFEGYLDPEDGPVAYRRQEEETPIQRSQSLDDLTESPLAVRSPTHSPMQGDYASGSPLQSSSPSPSSPNTRAVPAGCSSASVTQV